MNKKYVAESTEAERERLGKLISAGTAPARMLNRAPRILLGADVGGGRHAGEGRPALIDREIAEMLETSAATVGRERERFFTQGLDAALERSLPDRVYKRSLDGRAEARLVALACSRSPRRGGAAGACASWRTRPSSFGIVPSVSHETVRKTLKKTSSSPTWSKGG